MVNDFVFGAWLTLASTFILILAGILGWLVNQYISQRTDIQKIKNSYFGIAGEEGSRERLFTSLDEVSEQMEEMQSEMREQHRKIDDIVETLREHDINGDLPDE